LRVVEVYENHFLDHFEKLNGEWALHLNKSPESQQSSLLEGEDGKFFDSDFFDEVGQGECDFVDVGFDVLRSSHDEGPFVLEDIGWESVFGELGGLGLVEDPQVAGACVLLSCGYDEIGFVSYDFGVLVVHDFD
jgi:hypothetical protein